MSLLAEGLIVPSGLLMAAVLTRRLGAEGYGLFALATALVVWIEWTLTSLFNRATVKLVGSADDWRPAGRTIVRLHLAAGFALALALWLAAPLAASALGEPRLSLFLRVLSLEIPVFGLAQAYRAVLVGVGDFRGRALVSAARWTARAAFVCAAVVSGLGVAGAAGACVLATCAELLVVRARVGAGLLRGPGIALGSWWAYAAPLFLFSVSQRLFDKLDLFALKALGASAVDAGLYGAAQNLALAPSLFALSFTPLLVSSLSRVLHAGDEAEARALERQALRTALLPLPFAALASGAAPEIVTLFFGAEFAPAATPFRLLVLGASTAILFSVTTGVMIARGRPRWTFALAWPFAPAAILGHLLFIPRAGMTGAAAVTTCVASAGALASVLVVRRAWRVSPPAATCLRCAAVSAGAYAAAALWPAGGALVLFKLALLAAAAACALWALGEFGGWELRRVRAAFGWRPGGVRARRGEAS